MPLPQKNDVIADSIKGCGDRGGQFGKDLLLVIPDELPDLIRDSILRTDDQAIPGGLDDETGLRESVQHYQNTSASCSSGSKRKDGFE